MGLTKKEQKLLKDIGLELRQIRHDKGWTLEEVEEKGFPSWRHLQRIETGHKNITITTLMKLLEVYGLKITDIFTKS